MERLWQDLRYAFRLLQKTPGFTVVAIVTLGLGIGANTAIFSVVNTVLLQRLPFRDPDQLVMVFEHNFKSNKPKNVVNPGNFMAWRDRATSFESLEGMFAWQANVTGAGEPERITYGGFTPGLLRTVGVQPILGRGFTEADASTDAPDVVLLSETYWRRKFNADPTVIGRGINVDSEPATIIGVLPGWFELPGKMEMWQPWGLTEKHRQSRGRYMLTAGRLKPGVTAEQAQAEMSAVAASLLQVKPENAGWGVNVVPLREQIVGDVRPALLVLLGAVGLVLLISCANVANLLMVRSAVRSREIAIRVALGITRGRLVQQLLTESVLLGLAGGALGVLLASWLLEALLAIVPAELPLVTGIRLDVPVLLFTFGLATLTGLVFGLGPVVQALRSNWGDSLKESGRTSGAGATHTRLRNSFIMAQAALALMLLVGAGLVIRSFATLMTMDAGFRPENLLTMKIDLPSAQYKEGTGRVAFFQDALARIKSLPGVESAAAVTWLPLAGGGSATDFTLDDRAQPAVGDEPTGDIRAVTEDYFKAMRIGMVSGRTFDPVSDRASDEVKKVIVNEAMVRQYWPNENPIGKRISMEWGPMLHAEVVGVVRDVRVTKLEEEARATLYWYTPQFPSNFMVLVARTNTEPMSLAAPIRAQLSSIDPQLPVADLRTMEEVIGESVATSRFTMLLLAVFAATALLLAAIGIYGVISYTVTQRTHEIGVRMAFGARPQDIARMVLGQGMSVVGLGVLFGVAGALVGSRFLESLLFRVPATDLLTFVGVGALLIAVALVACYVPARRATRIDPMVALRYE